MARSSATAKLDALRKQLAEVKRNEREVAQTPGRLRAEAESLSDRLAESDLPVDGSPPPVGADARKLWDELQAVKIKLGGPWEHRRQKAEVEVARRESELAQFTADHFGELVAEIEPEAAAASIAVNDAITDLLSALDGWSEVEARVISLTRHVPGLDGQDVPRLPAGELRSELRRLAAEPTPRPLPRSLYDDSEEQAA